MFSRERLEVSHLNIFGCLVYIHIPKEKRSKLDPSRKKRLFVEYSEQLKSYWIYIPGYRQFDIGRDVIFDEDSPLKKSSKDKEDEEDHETPKTIESRKEVWVE